MLEPFIDNRENDNDPFDVWEGDIICLTADCQVKLFALCLMVVTSVEDWGCVGYIQSICGRGKVETNYRATWKEMIHTGGKLTKSPPRTRCCHSTTPATAWYRP